MPTKEKKRTKQTKKKKKKTSVTYNIYTKCKEALQNIMLFKIVVQKNNHHFILFMLLKP